MIGWLKHPSPVSAFGRSTLSRTGRGEAGVSSHTLLPSPLAGEGAPRITESAEANFGGDEGSFKAKNCAIWNDIARALEAK
jgi:hypothetical protein